MRRAVTDRSSAPAGPEVTLGRIRGPFGVKGWVKVESYTDPAEGILRYGEWHVQAPRAGHRVLKPIEGRRHGAAVLVRLEGVGDREAAKALAHGEIRVTRDQLPELPEHAHYRADLEGLQVVTAGGVVLGRVGGFIETPAHAVMVVVGERERLIPLVSRYLKNIDPGAGRVVVDWDPDY